MCEINTSIFWGGKPGSHRTIWTTFVHGYVSPATSTCTPCCEMMELGDTFDGGISFLSNLIYLGDESILISIWMISIWWDIQYLILIWSGYHFEFIHFFVVCVLLFLMVCRESKMFKWDVIPWTTLDRGKTKPECHLAGWLFRTVLPFHLKLNPTAFFNIYISYRQGWLSTFEAWRLAASLSTSAVLWDVGCIQLVKQTYNIPGWPEFSAAWIGYVWKLESANIGWANINTYQTGLMSLKCHSSIVNTCRMSSANNNLKKKTPHCDLTIDDDS